VLKVESLRVSYGKIEALKGVSLEVLAGELVALVGSNGAGKSTLMWTLAGVLRPMAGGVTFNGFPLPPNPSRVARMGMALVPERRRLFPELTVRENLLMGAFTRPRDEAPGTIEEVLQIFPPLSDKMDTLAGSLSGGEQQMVAIGRAIMSSPSLMLLDEPTLGLSPLMVDRVMDAILEVNRRGVSVLLVEQNAELALEISQRAYVLEGGSVVLEGPSRQVASNPAVRRAYLGDGVGIPSD
jgi:branched-chain amino acid transport system ATP-binding protein